MAEPMWQYVRDGEAVGPVTHADLCTLFADKDLPLETLVWHDGLEEWLAASGVDDFRGIWGKGFGRQGTTPPPLPAGTPAGPGVSSAATPSHGAASSSPTTRPSLEMRGRDHDRGRGRNRTDDDAWDHLPQVRPWVRYWARGLDHQILFTAAAFVFTPRTLWEGIAFFYGCHLLGTFIVFPVQLMMFGRTLGKVVFGISVEAEDGQPLTMSQAVAREWRVLLNGLGLLVLILPLFTLISAYRRLRRDGATSWDRTGGLVMRHREVGVGRWAAFLVLFAMLHVVTAVFHPKIDLAELRNSHPFGPPPSMASVMITPTTPLATTQPAGAKKPKPKPKLLTLPGDKGAAKLPMKQPAPTTRPVRRQDRPPPQVIFKPDPGPESK